MPRDRPRTLWGRPGTPQGAPRDFPLAKVSTQGSPKGCPRHEIDPEDLPGTPKGLKMNPRVVEQIISYAFVARGKTTTHFTLGKATKTTRVILAGHPVKFLGFSLLNSSRAKHPWVRRSRVASPSKPCAHCDPKLNPKCADACPQHALP
jgi:hypothetical protein